MFLDDCEFHVLKKQVKMLILALKSPKHSNMALSHYTHYTTVWTNLLYTTAWTITYNHPKYDVK